jgi:hypothetical protein
MKTMKASKQNKKGKAVAPYNIIRYILMAMGFIGALILTNYVVIVSGVLSSSHNGFFTRMLSNFATGVSAVDVDNLPIWGSYRPGLYFGMKSRYPKATVSTGLMWAPSASGKEFRHQTNTDELMFEWLQHDGTNYGIESMIDGRYGVELNASFIIPEEADYAAAHSAIPQTPLPTWAQRLHMRPTSRPGRPPTTKHSLLFYVGLDDAKTNTFKELQITHKGRDSSFDGSITVTGRSKATGWFCLVFLLHHSIDSDGSSDKVPVRRLSYYGRTDMDVLTGADAVMSEKKQYDRLNMARAQGPEHKRSEGMFDSQGDLMNIPKQGESGDCSFLAIQATFGGSSSIDADVLYFEHLDMATFGPMLASEKKSSEGEGGVAGFYDRIVGDLARGEEMYSRRFEERFSRVFGLQPKLASSDFYSGTGDTYTIDGTDGSAVARQDATFPATTTTRGFTEEEIGIAKKALCSMLGGIGYFEGVPRIEAVQDVGGESGQLAMPKQQWISLLTATPSRVVFPRGFLWDEGFHQMIVSRWSVPLSLHILSDWLSAMHEEAAPTASALAEVSSRDSTVKGWIPREMILGEESSRRVPDEFITQRSNIANPPTLLLAVEAMIARLPTPAAYFIMDNVCTPVDSSSSSTSPSPAVLSPTDTALVLGFLQKRYASLHQWVQWFLLSQKGSATYPSSFRWRGRSLADRKVVPNTLASGLDDYPRSFHPTSEEHHVDLHCWLAKACGIMADIEQVLSRFNVSLSLDAQALAKEADYAGTSKKLLSRLDALHWSEEHKGYFDVGMHNERTASFVTEVYFRCQNSLTKATIDVAVPLKVANSGGSLCPSSHQTVLFAHSDPDNPGKHLIKESFKVPQATLQHIPRVGYVAIFPVLLRLLDPFSPKLGHILDMMESPDQLWTDYGLRSIAKTDMFYQKRNSPGDAPYWRGPIWININYLAISALHYYKSMEGPHQARILRMYDQLRENVQRNVLKEYARTGFFWEQFDDAAGNGIRGHPFTGWTALFVNIMAEMF